MGWSNDKWGIVVFKTSTGGLQFSRALATNGDETCASGKTCTAKWHTHKELIPFMTATIWSTGRGIWP